jgi:hypothetical protein
MIGQMKIAKKLATIRRTLSTFITTAIPINVAPILTNQCGQSQPVMIPELLNCSNTMIIVPKAAQTIHTAKYATSKRFTSAFSAASVALLERNGVLIPAEMLSHEPISNGKGDELRERWQRN